MKNRSRLALLSVCILLTNLVLACGDKTAQAPTIPPATATSGAGPTVQVPPTLEAPTESPATEVPATQTPTQAPATQTPTQAPATQSPTATAVSSPTPQASSEPGYDDQGSPAALLASYVNAINRREYERAWGYWESPPSPSFDEFSQGFATTRSVLLAVRPPAWFGAAAGSVYAPMATLLLATHTDGSQHNFLGCYIARQQNVDPSGDTRWWLYGATVSPAPSNGAGAGLLVDVCEQVPPPGPTEPAYDDQDSPTAVLASYVNSINRREYERAWAYWDTPPNPTFEDFQQGYEGTDEVFLVVRPPTQFDAAAGSAYTSVPVIMMATHASSGRQSFVGCYVLRRSNVDGGPEGWRLYDATMREIPDSSPDVGLLATACRAP